jgi:putative ABC transport system permease protein
MFRNYLVTALRNLERNRLYAAISILGLAVAFAAAILIGQFVRHEFSYDHWIPGYQRVYKITDSLEQPGQPPVTADLGPTMVADQLRVVFPGAEAIARLEQASPPTKARPGDEAAADKTFAWADPGIFKVLPLPALAGDLGSALQRPDTVVITRSAARRYFHRDLPIGDTLMVQAFGPAGGGGPSAKSVYAWRTMRVTAVLEDLPSNTNLVAEVFASSRSTYSNLAIRDASPPNYGAGDAYTFVRLRPGISRADLQRALDVATRPQAALAANYSAGAKWLFQPVPLGEAHLTPNGKTAVIIKPTGSRAIAYGVAGVGALIVLVAAINFVTLMTARAARRGVEVGIRKAAGATRAALIVQFMGEALVQAAVAALIAAALAEMLIKPFGAFIQRDLALDFLRDPTLLAAIVCGALVVGLLAGIYPALVLSSFRPAAVLKGGSVTTRGSPAARITLVAVQFAVLVCLIVTTVTLYRQTQFALAQGLGATDSKLLIAAASPCEGAFDLETRKLPGVATTACSSYSALNMTDGLDLTSVQFGGARKTTFANAPVGFGFFELFGVRPLAGRLFSRDRGEDGVLADPNTEAMPTVIINQSAVRALGLPDPRMAIGKTLNWARERPGVQHVLGPPPVAPARIIGVVPDIPMTVRLQTPPTLYFVEPRFSYFVNIRLTGRDTPETVKAIADTWKRTNNGRPLNELFLSQSRLSLYVDLIVQSETIALCAGLAILIASLGLFALSAFTTERRTKEIGVRKAMGADTRQVVLLLLWQFTIPVLAATAIAIPVGALVMSWWLHGFAYHVDLSAWTFVLAAIAAVAIAWLTVSWQSFAVARAKPAGALRYE